MWLESRAFQLFGKDANCCSQYTAHQLYIFCLAADQSTFVSSFTQRNRQGTRVDILIQFRLRWQRHQNNVTAAPRGGKIRHVRKISLADVFP